MRTLKTFAVTAATAVVAASVSLANESKDYENCGEVTVGPNSTKILKVKRMNCHGARKIAARYEKKAFRGSDFADPGDVTKVRRFRCKFNQYFEPFELAFKCRHTRQDGKALKAFFPPEREGKAPGAKVLVACWNKGEPFENASPVLRHKPSKCSFYKRGEEANFARVAAKSLNWKRWDKRKAKGSGVAIASMVGYTPVKVRLSKPERNCNDKRVFSKGTFRFPELGTGGDMPLYTC